MRVLLLSFALAACATTPRGDVVRWQPIEVWKGDAAFERARIGRPDASDPNPQIVGVDQGGRVVLVHWTDGAAPRGEVLFTNPSEMTGLYVGDADPSVPGEGPWNDRLIFTDPDAASPDVERPKMKDAGFLVDPSGRAPHEALVVFKTGRTLYVDVDRPETARFVHDEPGGLSRVCPDADGGAYVAGYAGRVLHFVRDGNGFKVEAIDHEGPDSGLRGVALGRFPLPQGGVAPLAVFGFHRLCRALSQREGAWDTTTLFRDVERGHVLEACELVAGNDADELVLAGYSNRIVVLVARPTR
jgi:hypothetical protein